MTCWQLLKLCCWAFLHCHCAQKKNTALFISALWYRNTTWCHHRVYRVGGQHQQNLQHRALWSWEMFSSSSHQWGRSETTSWWYADKKFISVGVSRSGRVILKSISLSVFDLIMLVYIGNRVGDKTQPCGTPVFQPILQPNYPAGCFLIQCTCKEGVHAMKAHLNSAVFCSSTAGVINLYSPRTPWTRDKQNRDPV